MVIKATSSYCLRLIAGCAVAIVTAVVVQKLINRWSKDSDMDNETNAATEQIDEPKSHGDFVKDPDKHQETQDSENTASLAKQIHSESEAGDDIASVNSESGDTKEPAAETDQGQKVGTPAEEKSPIEEMGQTQGKPTKKQRLNEKNSLADFGYEFNADGELRSTDTNSPFEFNVKPGNHRYNQENYEALGKVVDEYVYDLLRKENLEQVEIPINAGPRVPKSFFFMSHDAANKDKLLVLIHGTGVVRAGQWARRLIINDNLNCGTQLPFIKRAIEEGYGVVVMNTNLNYDNQKRPIEGSSTAEEHGTYVWRNFIEKTTVKHIAIVAHSYGGVVVGSLAKAFGEDFINRVFAVAFTDSFGYQFGKKSSLHDFFKQRSVNWVSSDEPLDQPVQGYMDDFPMRSAGHTKHEWTSWSSFESIFKFFDTRYNLAVELQPVVTDNNKMQTTLV